MIIDKEHQTNTKELKFSLANRYIIYIYYYTNVISFLLTPILVLIEALSLQF